MAVRERIRDLDLAQATELVQRVALEGLEGILSGRELARVKELAPRCYGGDPAAKQEMAGLVRAILDRTGVQIRGLGTDDAVARIYAALWGLGTVDLERIWVDPDVDELQVTPRYVVSIRRGRLHRDEAPVPSATELRRVIDRVLFHVRGINESNPHVEATWGEGTRITATIPPRSTYPILIFRRHGGWAVVPGNLMATGMFDEQLLCLLKMLVRARSNILFCGPCGSGKTTLLRLAAGMLHPNLQVVTIEAGHPELLLSEFYPDRIYRELVAREGSELPEVFESALRQSPDLVIFGEIRSAAEAAAADKAVARGHAGSMATFHAMDPEEAVESMAVLLMEAGRTLPLDQLKLWVARRWNIVVNLWGDTIRGYKRVVGVTEIGVEGGCVVYRPICRWVPEGDEYARGHWQFYEVPAPALDRLFRQGDPGAMAWWREVSGRWTWERWSPGDCGA